MAVIQVGPYAVGDVIKARSLSVDGLQCGFNVTHWKVIKVTGLPPNPDEVAREFSTVWEGSYKALHPPQVEYRGHGVQRIHPVIDVETTDVSKAGFGTSGTGPLPPQCSPYVTLYSAGVGRTNRGRMYLPFASELWLGPDGRVTGAGLTLMDAFGNGMAVTYTITGAGGGTMDIQGSLWHRVGKTTSPIIGHRSNSAIGSQVRRSFTHRGDQVPF